MLRLIYFIEHLSSPAFWSAAEKCQVERFVIHFHFIYCLLSLLNPKLFYTLGLVILLLFISIYAVSEAIADGLNPFTISHIARSASLNIIGKYKICPGLKP